MVVMAVLRFIGDKFSQLGDSLSIQNFELYIAFSVVIIIAILVFYFFLYRPIKKTTSPEQSVFADKDIIDLSPEKILSHFESVELDKEEIELTPDEMEPLYESVAYATKIVGVTHKNEDGTKRQDLIQKLRPDEPLILKREPDNPFGDTAIAIYNTSEQQLGYIPSGDYRLADYMDGGDKVSAKVLNVTGGYSYKENYGCNILITKYFVSRYLRKLEINIDNKIVLAREFEKENPLAAIKLYKKSITEIKELDSLESGYRSVRYPINRLSLVLEKLKEYQNAYDEIIQYEQYENYTGLTKNDKEAVIKRRIRLEKKLK